MRYVRSSLFILVCIGFIIVPFVLLLLRSPWVSTLSPAKLHVATSNRYSVDSNVAGYTLMLVDTSYLDYVTANMKLFDPNAVVGMGYYTGKLAKIKSRVVHSRI